MRPSRRWKRKSPARTPLRPIKPSYPHHEGRFALPALLEPERNKCYLNRARGAKGSFIMADNSGGIGLLGVLIGALIVVVIGGAVLYATGVIGPKSSVTIQLPKAR